jgi:capsular polysaccharide biosynthesis protein
MSTSNKPDPDSRRSGGIFSRITRRWRLILLLWVIITTPLVYSIYLFVKPRFEAFSLLRVAPASIELYAATRPEWIDPKNVAPYIQTQVGLITSDRVLAPAIARLEVVNLSAITASDDPRAFLRERMTVEIVRDSNLLRVALELPDGNQAAAIVNAVAESYLEYCGEHQRSGNSTLRNIVSEQLVRYKIQIDEKRAELRKIYEKASISIGSLRASNKSGKESDPTRSALVTITEAQSQKIADEIINTDLDLIKAESILEATQAATNGENDSHVRQLLSDLRVNVASLLKQKEYQAKYFAGLIVEKFEKTDTSFETTFVNRQLDILMREESQLGAHLKQLEFESSQDLARVTLIDKAVAPVTPKSAARFVYMAATPIVVLLALMGLALLTPVNGPRAWTGE